MPSNKPRIATYTDEETLSKFRIIAAYHKKSMSNYLAELIAESIHKHEDEYGEIILQDEE